MSVGDENQRGDETLAGEYVLGLLAPAERARAERAMRERDTLAREVLRWDERLQPLLDAVPPVSPPARLWRAIEAELGDPTRRLQPREAPAGSLRGRVSAAWKWLAIGSMGLAAASLAALALDLRAPSGGETMITASIMPESGAPLFVAVIDPNNGQATLMPVALAPEAGRVPELWLVPAGGAPISLGVVDPSRPLRIDLGDRGPMGMMQAPGAALAVSMEPEGGSPTGQPTGPVVGQGVLQSI